MRNTYPALTLVLAATAAMLPRPAAEAQGATQMVQRSTPAPAAQPLELERLFHRHDSLSRRLDALPLGARERQRVVDDLLQVAREIVGFDASPRPGTAPIVKFGIVIAPDIREVIERNQDAGRDMLERAMPRGMLGFTATGLMHQELRPDGMYIRYFDYPTIELVDPNTPADSAGIAVGDRLVGYNGDDILRREINLSRMLEPDRRLRIQVDRAGQIRDFALVVVPVTEAARQRRTDLVTSLTELRPPGEPSIRSGEVRIMATRTPGGAPPSTGGGAAVASQGPVGSGEPGRIMAVVRPGGSGGGPAGSLIEKAGMQVLDLNPQLANTLGVAGGVFVVVAAPGSPAYAAGLTGGDVIVRVGPNRVHTLSELTRLIEAERGPTVKLETLRGGKSREIELPIR